MSDQEEDRSLGDRLQDTYRLSFIEEETLREVKRYQVTPLMLYLLALGSILLIGAAVVSLIFFTPVRRLVPGFGDINENRKFVELTDQVEALEEELAIQHTYTEGLMNMLRGESTTELAMQPADDIMSQPITPQDSISASTVRASAATVTLDKLVLVPPIRGSVSAGFDLSEGHLGVDILAPKDSPVAATSDGIVIQSGWTLETGNTVAIQHRDNLVTFYKHNAALLKEIGDPVRAGEAIAIIGNSGTLSDGPHLHFEVWHDGRPLDPQSLLTF